MKKIEVLVRDKNTLILKENAEAGDYIDLSSLSSVDFSALEAAIESGKDRVLKEKMESFQHSSLRENEWKLKENDRNWEKRLAEKEKEYQEKNDSLQAMIRQYDLNKKWKSASWNTGWRWKKPTSAGQGAGNRTFPSESRIGSEGI